MKLAILSLGTASLLSAAAATGAPITVQSGSFENLSWTAKSTIVGVTSTATAAAGGDSRYFAPMPKYNGVATLIMNYGTAGSFICSGTLLPDRRSILTAAHCVSDGTSSRPLSTTVSFYTGNDPDTVVWAAPSFSYSVSHYSVHSAYTGDVIDQNDIAVLRLSNWVDASINAHDLYTGELTGQDFNVAGYGLRSSTGGSTGASLGTGRLRQGDNRYDFRLGDADFGGMWAAVLGEPASQIAYSYLSDFDNGSLDNDLSCNIAVFGFGISPSSKYCDPGRGASEVSTAGGDSGGPQFINNLVSSVTSYGLTFGSSWGDVDNSLNSSFGEFNGFVPVSIHADFIRANYVPEPGSFALVGLGLFAGVLTRRQRCRA